MAIKNPYGDAAPPAKIERPAREQNFFDKLMVVLIWLWLLGVAGIVLFFVTILLLWFFWAPVF